MMDNRRYQELRTYCLQELGENMSLPGYDAVMQHAIKEAGGVIGRIWREEYLARHLFQCIDLTPRERAAAYLLAVITNHRAITWEREPCPPVGHKQLPPLEKREVDELSKVTSDAVKRYAAFLPESERAVLMEDCEAALEAAPGQPEQAPMDGEPAAKTGRPPEIARKAEILRQIIQNMTMGKELDPNNLPGVAANLLDACQRIEHSKVGKTQIFSKSEDAFKSWLKTAGYGFKNGRAPSNEANYWTLLCVETMAKIDAGIFTGVTPEQPL